LTVKFDEIDKVIDKMTSDQMKMVLLILAVKIKDVTVIDKIDYVDAMKIGFSMPPE